MKKVILVTTVFLSALTFSCSSDDDANDTTDPIVGTWKYTQSLVDGKEESLSACEKKGNYVFATDGKANDNYYEDVNSECELDAVSGTWKKNDNGTYTGTFTDSVEEYSETFKLSDGKLLIEETDGGKLYTEVYTR
ncbi:lipocalin-like domain-containing protein [Aquimarina macrocephali]|uniref:lipocalin family protein n=1 Tax=Aquimarina macrocephali TaxID=666563 RepID=UPI00046762A7|nr:lipocalin family protein [Aquimarina macrocephali]